ncbi:MAG: FkbM family methyltransferase [Armatimonadetes bacterium]|nr:FkbM family methyltransferase [Armatimonadota bacterium]
MAVGDVRARFHVSSRRELQRISVLTGEKQLLVRVLGELRQGDVVFDVGANIGTHAIAFAKTVGEGGRVAAFEPEPDTAQRLEDNVVLNGLLNVSVHRFGLGPSESTATLYVDARPGSGLHSMSPAEGRTTQQVRVARGDDLVATGALPAPNVIKIDVEGAELGVLEGLAQALRGPACRLVLCEVHADMLSLGGRAPEEVEQWLRDAGFTRFEHARRGTEDHLMAWKDASTA